MLGTQNLWLFVVSGLLLNMAPGPDSLLIMSRSATQGWRAGFVTAWGIGVGTCVHVLAAALGLSALLATSATAFLAVKIAGAAYLAWMGWGMLRARVRPGALSPAVAQEATDGPEAPAASIASAVPAMAPAYLQIFLQGLLTNVLNPKVALFFLAFVPQFIAPDAASKPLAFIVLGAIFDVNGMLWCHGLALAAAFAGSRMKVGTAVGRWLERAMGAVFLTLGVKLALASR